MPSTPDDPSRAILAGIEALLGQGVAAADISYFCHGTTVGTNALLEGKGVKTGLLVTEGFRGIYPVGEQARPYGAAIFDVMYDKPALLVPQSLTGEVKERVDFRGEVLRPLDEDALRATVRELAAEEHRVDRGLPAVLVPASASTRSACARSSPEEMPDCSISLSSEILPQIREYYRLSHHGDQRLSAADPGALHRPARPPARRAPASRRGRNTSCSRTAACRPSRPPRARR